MMESNHQVRWGVFETNSSSTHVFRICKGGPEESPIVENGKAIVITDNYAVLANQDSCNARISVIVHACWNSGGLIEEAFTAVFVWEQLLELLAQFGVTGLVNENGVPLSPLDVHGDIWDQEGAPTLSWAYGVCKSGNLSNFILNPYSGSATLMDTYGDDPAAFPSLPKGVEKIDNCIVDGYDDYGILGREEVILRNMAYVK